MVSLSPRSPLDDCETKEEEYDDEQVPRTSEERVELKTIADGVFRVAVDIVVTVADVTMPVSVALWLLGTFSLPFFVLKGFAMKGFLIGDVVVVAVDVVDVADTVVFDVKGFNKKGFDLKGFTIE